MSNPTYTSLAAERNCDAISELALDLRWTWNHSTDELWRELEPELWKTTQNPWLILQAVSQNRLQRLLAEPRFCDRIKALLEKKRERETSPTWFDKHHSHSGLTAIAYFSMEYMLGEALPIYAGGLGNAAGDQLKTASDLGVPVVAIGLMYQQGYFRQEFDAEGRQIAQYPFNDPGQLPIRPLRNHDGDWLRLRITLPGDVLWIRAWEAKVGRRKLYLLDTNDPANRPAYRAITGQLYGGGPELRLRQEAVLGIGGWRLLRALGIRPEVCHLNEGHSAFSVLERARSFMEDNAQPFDVALAVTRAGNLFTTHSPVDAAFDRFAPELMETYFRRYAEQRLRISMDELLALGRRNAGDAAEPFNMAYLAMRGSGAVIGVSRLHGAVSRHLFRDLFSRWPEPEVPVGHVTNGIHVPTWDSAEADALWEQACGEERWRGSLEYVEQQIRCVSDIVLWDMRCNIRNRFVAFVRERMALQRAHLGASPGELEEAGRMFDESRLTLGFARRFVQYKRPNLLLQDPERLVRILTNPQRPAQLLIAGKADPRDPVGQSMVRQWNEFIRRPELRGRVAFLADYDMLLSEQMVAGVDLWINTPRRPWEASGTSGMKVLANGGLNLSELDGWWAEAYAPDIGWAVGDGRDRGDDASWDATEASALYELLEREVIPTFYDRDERGIPREWVARVRESMARLTPAFSANRTVRQYTEEHYISRAAAYCHRAASSGRAGAELLKLQRTVEERWRDLRFGQVAIASQDGAYSCDVQVYLGRLQPDNVRIEMYADPLVHGPPFRELMTLAGSGDSSSFYRYSARVPANRPVDHYTPRAVPRETVGAIPLEVPLITWQK
jgi:glycogen phosphorylase